MKRHIIHFLLLSLSWHTSLAQVNESVEKSTARDSAQQENEPAEDTESRSGAVTKPEPEPEATVFNPTEEISEDSPVPFPVDI